MCAWQTVPAGWGLVRSQQTTEWVAENDVMLVLVDLACLRHRQLPVLSESTADVQ